MILVVVCIYSIYIQHQYIKINDRLVLKPFDYKNMTTFRRHLVAKVYMEAQLILFEGYHCQITADSLK